MFEKNACANISLPNKTHAKKSMEGEPQEMKMIRSTVDMIAIFRKAEPPEPVRFRYSYMKKDYEIKVGQVVDLRKEYEGEHRNYIYQCKSLIGRRERTYELKYDGRDARWELVRIS